MRTFDPDQHAAGLLKTPPNPLRYDGHSGDPDEIAAIVVSMVPRGARVLDIGCGTGDITKAVMDACDAEAVAVEPNAQRAALAASLGIDVRVGAFDANVASGLGRFDVVLLSDVLEHVPEPLELLTLAAGLLDANGRIVASVPNVAHWSVRVDLARGHFRYQSDGIMDATHLRWFTAESVQLLFRAAGLQIREQRVTAGFFLDVYNDKRPIKWLPRRVQNPIVRRMMRRWPNLFGCQFVVRATREPELPCPSRPPAS